MIRLYRCTTVRDKQKEGYIISSKVQRRLTNLEAFGEIISHELNAGTGRGVFYSFSPDVKLVKAYKERNPENKEICYLDIDLDRLPTSIIGIYPVYLRDYLLCLAANTQEVLELGGVVNPETKRLHTLLGLTNVCQRNVAGWASSMKEIMIQTKTLKLNVWDEAIDENKPKCDNLDELFMKHCIARPDSESITALRDYMRNSFNGKKLKRQYLKDRIETDEWFKYSAQVS